MGSLTFIVQNAKPLPSKISMSTNWTRNQVHFKRKSEPEFSTKLKWKDVIDATLF